MMIYWKKSIWGKVSADIRKKKKKLKTKIKSYNDELTDFHNKEMPKAGSSHTCLTVITIDFAFRKMITIMYKCS